MKQGKHLLATIFFLTYFAPSIYAVDPIKFMTFPGEPASELTLEHMGGGLSRVIYRSGEERIVLSENAVNFLIHGIAAGDMNPMSKHARIAGFSAWEQERGILAYKTYIVDSRGQILFTTSRKPDAKNHLSAIRSGTVFRPDGKPDKDGLEVFEVLLSDRTSQMFFYLPKEQKLVSLRGLTADGYTWNNGVFNLLGSIDAAGISSENVLTYVSFNNDPSGINSSLDLITSGRLLPLIGIDELKQEACRASLFGL